MKKLVVIILYFIIPVLKTVCKIVSLRSHGNEYFHTHDVSYRWRSAICRFPAFSPFILFFFLQKEVDQDENHHKLLGTSQGLLCFTLFITLMTNVQNIRKYGHQDDSYYTGLMLNCLCVCLQVFSLSAAFCQCLKEFMVWEVPILMATLNRTILKLSAVIVFIQIFLWLS